jgi:hypothetical protein
MFSVRRLLPAAILVFSSAAAHAGWPVETQNLIAAENQRSTIRVDPFTATVADGIELKLRGWECMFPGAQSLTLLRRSTEFLTPAGGARGLTITHWGSDIAPLVVYLPGIFQMSDDADTARVVDAMLEAGYHVVVIANPLSREYMANDPVAPAASYDREAAIVHEAIVELRKRFNAGPARLIAASHGSNLAVRAWAIDQDADETNLQDLTLLFPQVHVSRSIELVDSHIDAPTWPNPARRAVGRLYLKSLQNYVERRQLRFNEDLAAGFTARKYSLRAARHLQRYHRRGEGRTLTLKTVLAEYVDDTEVSRAHEDDVPSLFAWLERARAVRGNSNVRLLTAEDDWTNPPGAWDAAPQWLRTPERLLMLRAGGHAGVVHHGWFRAAVVAAMR